MNKNEFSGWIQVFKFTMSQAIKAKGFKFVTIGLAILFFAIAVGGNLIAAFVQSDDSEKISEVETVYIVNQTDIKEIDFSILTLLIEKKYDEVKFEISDKSSEILLKENTVEEGKNVILEISQKDDGYNLNLMIPYNSSISKSDGKDLVADLSKCFLQSKLISSNVSPVVQMMLLSGVDSEVIEAGEKAQSIGEQLVKTLLPMLTGLLFYMLTILYGQSIGATVIAEKSSKLMETLLVTVKSSAIIAGKILAIASLGIAQLTLWMASIILGFFVGNIAAKEVYTDYSNVIFQIVDLLKESTKASAFSPISIVLAIVVLFAGFFLYSVLAGFFAANVNKSEELPTNMGLYQMIVIACFFTTYFLQIKALDGISYAKIFAVIPFTAPFSLPADLLVGNVSIIYGFVGLVVLLIFIVISIILTGNIYRNRIFYNGANKNPLAFLKK